MSLLPYIPVREGYTFNGWNTKKDGSGENYNYVYWRFWDINEETDKEFEKDTKIKETNGYERYKNVTLYASWTNTSGEPEQPVKETVKEIQSTGKTKAKIEFAKEVSKDYKLDIKPVEVKKDLKIVFMGTPDFAKESLKCLAEAKHNILAVVTNPDKPQGRGMKMVASPVKQYALENGLEIYQPEKVRNNTEFIEKMKALKPDVICVVAYGKILPQELLDIPKLGCINVHGSLLPKYRGAAPIQWAVLNGDKTTGITTMYMDAGMDTGDMILKQEVEIGEDETTGELWERLSNIGADLLIETIKQIEAGTVKKEKQPEEGTLAPMLSKEMAKIDWENKTAVQIKNLVRGLNPIMGAYAFLNGSKIKFWKVDVAKNIGYDEDNIKIFKNGTVLISDQKDGLFIKTEKGILSVLEIQGENAKRMSINDFLRGNQINEFEVFE